MISLTDARTIFETRIPEIERLAAPHFRRMGPEAVQEGVQNTLVLCWRYFLRLVEVGKHDQENVFRSMVWWAVKLTKEGRRGGGCDELKAKCVLDYARRGKGNVVIQGGINLNFLIGPSASIPDAVAFRLDVPAFLGTLPERDRGIALSLAQGMGTTEVARKYNVTPGAISQFRTRFKRRYDEFQSEI